MNWRKFLRIAGVFLVVSLASNSVVKAQSVATAEQANEYFQAKEWSKAAAAYESVTAANPKNAAAWFRLGHARHQLGEYQKAIEAYQEARTAGYPPGPVSYNITCAHARMGKIDEAFQRLHQMLQNGWAQVELLETDADLDNLRKDARFEAALLH
ncbi:MAG: TPR end-of-group domain-containing protein, partial [Candidatus Acidiferrales bacterium]